MNATKQKKLTKSERAELVVKVKGFLRVWDRHLYGISATCGDARRLLKERFRIDASSNLIGRAAKSQGTYWRKDTGGGRHRTPRISYDGIEWNQMHEWIAKNRNDIDEFLDTPSSIARRMRRSGIITSPPATIEALKSSGISLNDEPYPQPSATSRDPNVPNPILGTDDKGKPIAASQLRLVNREGGAPDAIPSPPKAKDYPPDIWLAGATKDDIEAGMDVKAAYAKSVKHWREQGRLEATS